MKKIIALLLTLCLALTLFGCAQAPADNNADTNKDQVNNTDNTDNNDNTDVATAMTYAEYAAAELDAEVTVECYVQATQGWWEKDGQGVITVYAQDQDGAYFLYEMKCAEADAAKLTAGTKIRVTGYKGEWAGEVEVMDGEFEFIEGADTYVAEPVDATELLASEDLINYQNQKVCFKGVTVAAANDEGAAFLYKWDGSGAAGDDLYFNVTVGDATYTFCVESYLTGDGTDVYEAVEALKVGDVIDAEGFLYWYEGAQPHITAVTAAA